MIGARKRGVLGLNRKVVWGVGRLVSIGRVGGRGGGGEGR